MYFMAYTDTQIRSSRHITEFITALVSSDVIVEQELV
jgi:hypothetical protein